MQTSVASVSAAEGVPGRTLYKLLLPLYLQLKVSQAYAIQTSVASVSAAEVAPGRTLYKLLFSLYLQLKVFQAVRYTNLCCLCICS